MAASLSAQTIEESKRHFQLLFSMSCKRIILNELTQPTIGDKVNDYTKMNLTSQGEKKEKKGGGGITAAVNQMIMSVLYCGLIAPLSLHPQMMTCLILTEQS